MLLQILLDFIKAETQLSSSYTLYNAEELCKVKQRSLNLFRYFLTNNSFDVMLNFNIAVTYLVYLPELQQQLEDHRSHDWVFIWGLVKRRQIFGVNLFMFWFKR